MSQLSVFLQRTITGVLWLVGAVIFFRWLLGPLMPFLLALALSAMAEPLVQRVRRLLKVRRSFAAALVTTFFLLVLGGGAGLVLGRLVLELRQWSARLPEAIAGFPAVWNGLIDRVEDWYASSPAFLRSALDALAEQLMEDGPSLAGDVGGWLMGAASSLLAALPDAGLFLMTTVLAVYFTSLSYPAILAFLKRQLPTAWQAKCRDAANCFRSTILKWLRAECLLLLAGLCTAGGGIHRPGGRPAGTRDRDCIGAVGAGLHAAGGYRARPGSADAVCGGLDCPHAAGAPPAGRPGGSAADYRAAGDVPGIPLPGRWRDDPAAAVYAAAQAVPGCGGGEAVALTAVFYGPPLRHPMNPEMNSQSTRSMAPVDRASDVQSSQKKR